MTCGRRRMRAPAFGSWEACLAQRFPEIAARINRDFKGDFVLLNNFDAFPEIPPAQAAQYDFQIIHVPLRSILSSAYFQLPDDAARHEEFLRETQDYLARYLANVLQLNTGRKLQTFVLGFAEIAATESAGTVPAALRCPESHALCLAAQYVSGRGGRPGAKMLILWMPTRCPPASGRSPCRMTRCGRLRTGRR